jgi:hypothetical protein
MSLEKKRVFLTVKAFPEKSKKYGACVCTAGITEEGQFIRMFPIPFEKFRGGKNIPKYTWISVECEKASEYLERKESYRVIYDSIQTKVKVDTDNNWQERNKIVLPLVSPSLETLKKNNEIDKTSLGIIKPAEITELSIDDNKDCDEDELEIRRQIQLTLDGEKRTDLEHIGYNFRYHFRCNDNECKGHNIMCEDWEMLESWRSWKTKYGNNELLIEKFKAKFLDYMKFRDIYFFLGTHSQFNTWLIIGLYYPPFPK